MHSFSPDKIAKMEHQQKKTPTHIQPSKSMKPKRESLVSKSFYRQAINFGRICTNMGFFVFQRNKSIRI